MNIDKIYIPTLGRVDNQITYNALPDFLKKITYLVIQDHELTEIKKNFPDANLIRLPEQIKGIARTREYIIRLAGKTIFGMFDDDMEFIRRNIDRKTLKKVGDKSQTPMTEQDWKEMIQKVETWLNGDYTIGGMRMQGLPPRESDDIEFGKIAQVFFINGNKITPNKIKWDIQFSEDIYFILQVLSQGGKTIMTDKFLYTHPNGYFSEGGCSNEGRTVDSDTHTIREVANRFPHIIKFTNDHYDRDGELSQKYIVNWKKAYKTTEYNEFDKWK